MENFPAGGGLQKIDAPQQSGFAGARRANDAGYIAGVDRKIDVLQNFVFPEGFTQMPDFQYGFAAHGTTCPIQIPRVAPENLPSVIKAHFLPKPLPTKSEVGASISRIPGPPLGPS